MEPEKEKHNPAEAALIRKAARGDLDAFNHLVLVYQGLVYNRAYVLLSDRPAAEDATQESFIKAFQNIGKFRGGSFRAWLLKIVTNTAYDMLRRAKQRPKVPLMAFDRYGDEFESATWMVDPGLSVQDTVEQNELFHDITLMLNELTEDYRRVIILVDLYDLNYSETAALLRIPIGTVKSRLARARLQMRQKLQSHSEYSRNFNEAVIAPFQGQQYMQEGSLPL